MTISPLPLDRNFNRAALLDRLYRHISRLDDDSLTGLEALITSTDAFVLQEETAPIPARPGISRRGVLLALLLGGAATAAGGAALILQQPGETATPIPTPADRIAPTLQGQPLSAPPAPTSAPAVQQLADANAEQLALHAQLDSLRTSLNDAQAEQARLEAVLADREINLADLQQVVALYEQMEAVGLDEVLRNGLGPLGVAVIAVQATREAVRAGVEQAAALLAGVEVQAPAIANGLIWLEDQVNQLAALLQQLEDAVSQAVEPVAPAAQQIASFIDGVLDLLPFGVGEHIRTGLQTISTILTHIPELVASINPRFITPLRQWVSPEADKGLVAEVVHPISENLVTPAQRMVDDAATLDSTYTAGFKQPVEQALAVRATLREQLATLTGEAVG